jgi:predicted transposase YdaD
VHTDRPIKLLFERQGQSLLPFIGETQARVTAAESVTLSVPSREVDCVLRLEHDGAVWYRHLEFQSGPDSDMARRCYEYNSRLILHYQVAVLTTVVYLLPGADRGAQDAYRLYIGDRLAFEWRFDVVRLWEIPVDRALETSEAGPLALVPLLQGGDESENLQEAARKLDALPRLQSSDALSVFLDFASQRYDRKTLLKVLGKDRIMQSYLWQWGVEDGQIKGRAQGLAEGKAEGKAEGSAEGKAEGEARASREICADLTQEFHPRVSRRVLPAILRCEQPEALRAWILACPKLSDAAFVKLVTGEFASPSRAKRRRSVPARKRR